MTYISVEDATAHFEDVLEQVENGETIQITRDGLAHRPESSGIQAFDLDEEAERAAREWIRHIGIGGQSPRSAT